MKKLFNGVNDFLNIIEAISDNIQEGTIEKDGKKISINKSDGKLRISVEEKTEDETESYDNSELLQLISEFKDMIENLDDCVFCDACEAIEPKVNLTRMNYLMDIDDHTEEEADDLKVMIGLVTDQIVKTMSQRIHNMQKIIKKIKNETED